MLDCAMQCLLHDTIEFLFGRATVGQGRQKDLDQSGLPVYHSYVNNTPHGIDENVSLLLRLLLKSEKITDERLENALRDIQLTKAKMAALQQLIEAEGPLPLGQLAERLRCVKSNATTLMDRLEAEGLAERLHEPEDRRTVYAMVTEEGRRRYEDGMQAIKAVERELLEHFTQAERAQFIEYLTRLGALWE